VIVPGSFPLVYIYLIFGGAVKDTTVVLEPKQSLLYSFGRARHSVSGVSSMDIVTVEVLSIQKVWSSSGGTRRLRLRKYIGHRLVVRPEPNIFWNDSTLTKLERHSARCRWQYYNGATKNRVR